MKRLILTALLALACLSASATGQIHDKVIIEGETWEMPSSPLLSLDAREYEAFQELLGERNFVSTANYRGYVATWHVGRKGLYLDKVEVMQSNGKMKEIGMKELMTILKKHKHKGMIRAEWITGLVKIGKGAGLVDPDNPHAPSFADNWTLQLKKGRVKNM